MQIAVLGTGIMGTGMARSLLRAGHDVRVWNRTADKAEALEQHGAVATETPAAAVHGADLVATMLFDADSVLEVMADSAGDFGPEAIWLQTSTIGLDGITRVARFAREHGLTLLDAPVLGTKTPAEQGNLVMLVAGEEQAVDRARPFFDAVGTKEVYAGPELGQGSALKLVCNAWVATLTAALGQSVAMAERLDVDPRLFLEAITGGATDMPYAHAKAASMLSGEYPTAFAVDGAVKDLGLIADAAREAPVDPRLLDAVAALFCDASSRGYGGQDMAAVRVAFGRPPHT
jgi:3-hydroxyisobutyrate dehydrogenase